MKRTIMDQVVGMMAELSEGYKEVLAGAEMFPEEALKWSPKIARGEYYEGLPYVMLDYPRLFGRAHVLAVRTFFWWGHYFSLTLHLKGDYQLRYLPVIKQRLAADVSGRWWIAAGGEEWDHAVVNGAYRQAQYVNTEEWAGIEAQEFFKLSVVIPLAGWDTARAELAMLFATLIEWLK